MQKRIEDAEKMGFGDPRVNVIGGITYSDQIQRLGPKKARHMAHCMSNTPMRASNRRNWDWIMEKAEKEDLGEKDVARVAQMMLRGVDAIHKVGVMHCGT